MDRIRNLDKKSLDDLLKGACFLGSGGGGSLSSAMDTLAKLRKDATVEVCSVEEAAKDHGKLTVVVACMGAPKAAQADKTEKEAVNAFAKMQDYLWMTVKKEIGYLIPVEVGALSMLVPYIVASAHPKVKIVDADGAGRAVPELTMLTFAGKRLSTNPTVMASAGNEAVILEVDNAVADEGLARPILDNELFAEMAGLAIWPMDAEALRRADTVQGTLSLCCQAGKLVGRRDSAAKLVELMRSHHLPCEELFKGKVVDFQQQTKGGFDRGHLMLQSESGETCTIINKNENLIAWSSTQSSPLIMAPDSICCITSDGKPFSNGEDPLRILGKEATIIGIGARNNLKKNDSIMAAFRGAIADIGYMGEHIWLSPS